MAKKKKAAAKKSRKSKGIIDKVIEAISPPRRNSRGGNVTRRQGV